MTSGKRRGLEAVSDSRGIIAAVAMDRRSALRSLFARAMGVEPEAVPLEGLVEFKKAVSRTLSPHGSAILLDPEYGLPATRERRKRQDFCSRMSTRATIRECREGCRSCWRAGPCRVW